MPPFTLHDLEARIAERATADPADSWTARLVAGGTPKTAQKLGEEAVETVIAALAEDREALTRESADLIYHLLVLLHERGVSLDNVLAELQMRTSRSGVAEKAARKGE